LSPPTAGHVATCLQVHSIHSQDLRAAASVGSHSQTLHTLAVSDRLGAWRGRLIRLHLDGGCMSGVMANITWLLVMVHGAAATSFSKTGFWI
jgi:hypothetical protein